MDLPSAPQRPILSARSAISERRSTLMVYTAPPARASRLALGRALANQNGAVLTLSGRQMGLIVAADLNGLVISLR